VPTDARQIGGDTEILVLKAVRYLSEFATLMGKMGSGDVEKMETATQKLDNHVEGKPILSRVFDGLTEVIKLT